jgi:hypothetical protein
VTQFKLGENNVIDVLIEGAELKEDVMQGRRELDVNGLLALRAFVNFFDAEPGRGLMAREYEKVLDAAKIGVGRSMSKPVKVAFSTLLIKYPMSHASRLMVVTLFYFSGNPIQITRLHCLILSLKQLKIRQPTLKPFSVPSWL